MSQHPEISDRALNRATLARQGLLEPLRRGVPAAEARGRVLVPDEHAQFGVISDMDDTVVQTDVTRWVRVLGAVLFGNAHTRLPFRGVAAFYRALETGTTGVRNPLFYVSSSPWNLYDLLLEFLTVGDIPLGPLNLRAWRGGAGELFPSEHGAFKQNEIRRILDAFPKLPFILIGDSGEQDPEIYGEIVSSYPGRILAVYIRDVSGEPRRGTVTGLAQRVQDEGSQLVLASDTLVAAQHALAQGWLEGDLAAHGPLGDRRDLLLQANRVGEFVDAFLRDHGGIHVGQEQPLAPVRSCRQHGDVDRLGREGRAQASGERRRLVG